MMYSDLKIPPDLKIEILPTDRFCDERDVLEKGDRLVGVFRGVNGNFITDMLKDKFLYEFKFNFKYEKLSPGDALFYTVNAFQRSMLHPPTDFIPRDRVEVIVLYICNGKVDLVKQGDIKIKRKIDGKYEEMMTSAILEY